jgi:bacteriocin biosynthesis cyclodehydratase domain-containing protein
LLGIPELEADPVAAIRRYDAVLALGSPGSHELATLSSLCREQDVLFVPITLGARYAGIGPVIGRGTHGCWRCYVSRLSNDADAEQDAEQLAEERVPCAPTSLAMIATLAARELSQAWTDRDSPQESSVMEVNLRSLETRRHPLVKLTSCEGCAGEHVPREGELARAGHPPRSISSDALVPGLAHPLPKARLSRLERLVDPRTGVLSRLDEADLPQEPLNQCRATLCLPGARQPPFQIYGAGPTPIDARLATFKRALEFYGSLVPSDEHSLRWLAGELTELDSQIAVKRTFAVELDEDPSEAASGLALAQSHGRLHGWRELIPSSDDIDPFSAGLIEYLRALNVRWRIDTLHVDTLGIYRFWMGEKLAAVLSGREQARVVREGLQEIWLQTSHGSFAASSAEPFTSYVGSPASVARNTALPPGASLYQIETPEYRAADCWRFCLLVGAEGL